MTTTLACPHCQSPADCESVFCGNCGTRLAGVSHPSLISRGTLQPGDLVVGGRFRIERLLGAGGMGSVYRANDVRLNRACALKILLPELTAHPTARRRMEQEARALARIEHPNVVQVRNSFDDNGLLVIELELVTGGDLAARIATGGMGEAKALPLMVQILSGLQAIHEAGLVHRDLKAENVLLTADGVPKVTDLGVARDAMAVDRTTVGARLGTLETMAPEQIQGLEVDARADVYAAGILLFQMVTGRLPLQGTNELEWAMAHMQQAPNLTLLRGKASPKTERLIARALAKLPQERPASAAHMRVEVERIQQHIARAFAAPPAEATRAVPMHAVNSPMPHSTLRASSISAKLLGVDSANFPEVFALRMGEQRVGRGAETEVRIRGEGVSREHAIVICQPDGVWIRDLGSINGVLVNGERLHGATRLEPGATIQMGAATLKLL